jgi:hypothetical protein
MALVFYFESQHRVTVDLCLEHHNFHGATLPGLEYCYCPMAAVLDRRLSARSGRSVTIDSRQKQTYI